MIMTLHQSQRSLLVTRVSRQRTITMQHDTNETIPLLFTSNVTGCSSGREYGPLRFHPLPACVLPPLNSTRLSNCYLYNLFSNLKINNTLLVTYKKKSQNSCLSSARLRPTHWTCLARPRQGTRIKCAQPREANNLHHSGSYSITTRRRQCNSTIIGEINY